MRRSICRRNLLCGGGAVLGVLASGLALGQGVGGEDTRFQLDELHVIGETEADYSTAAGAAQRIDEETLERDEYDNINRILNDVPGVYIRGEDGFGNRPNIGLRGTTTERSQKITLMVDGVLAAPAPYSAPAAYYFPQVSRMTGVEVVKGPSAITSGPATVGGAVNLNTRSIPGEAGGSLDLGVGEDGYRKAHGYYGNAFEHGGFLVEGIRTQSDGFKDLDGGGDTGFEKNDFMVKARLNSDPAEAVYQQLDLTLESADETSDETYLGLADSDYRDTPFRRYAGSRNALFDWDYRKAQLNHLIEFGDEVSVNTTAYYQDFERAWTKFREFEADRGIQEILQNPDAGRNRDFIDVLRGVKDSEVSARETLLIETNDREYYSRGLQSVVRWRTRTGELDHTLRLGARFHQDQVERDHTDNGFLMRSGRLVPDGNPTEQTLRNRENADALAVFVQDEIQWNKWRLTPGVRVESIEYESLNRQTAQKQTNDNREVLPGFGAFYQWRPSLGFLAGVHRGFVPTGPAVSDDVEPEESINYEAGLRYSEGVTSGELIGFFNDYSNLLASCSFSTGCDDITDVFNGGEVDVYGLEARLAHRWQLAGLSLPASLAYTYTETEFKTDFQSSFPLWRDISKGDRLPYMPRHRLGLNAGVEGVNWGSTLKLSVVSEQQEQSGEGGALEGASVASHAVVDWKTRWTFTQRQEVYLNVNNLFDREYLLSRRPLGARPGQPRTIKAGYKIDF